MTQTTNVLIIGGGGREHALGWKIKQSRRCGRIYFAPGNGGTAGLGENVDLPTDPVTTQHADRIDWFCRQRQVGLIVIGPEGPLAGGLADRLQREGRDVFGPGKEAARLEADKAWAKQLMRAARIPTAESRVFQDPASARQYLESREAEVVVKASGLAGGKGVVVCRDRAEAMAAVDRCMRDRAYGEGGATVVIEEKLVGQEVSVLALVDGRNLYLLDPAQDHKPVGEGDTGPNTGGMGAYCPTALMDEPLLDQVQRQVLVPVVDAMRRDGVDYRGVLYAGLMLTAGGPKVLEFNCRFGDPETQPMMMRLEGDLLQILQATCRGRLKEVQLDWSPQTAVCVVMTAGGYPGEYEKGRPIEGLAEAEADEDVTILHAGTQRGPDGGLMTAGGRVLNVCARGRDLKEARQRANAACGKIHFHGAHYRRDIGFRVMR